MASVGENSQTRVVPSVSWAFESVTRPGMFNRKTMLVLNDSALENLRLDLLRLRAGVGEATEITGAVEAARQVGADISAEIEGRAEVERPTGG